MQTYYDLLGVSQDATVDEIKKAYFSASQIYHPDKNRNLSPQAQKLAEEKMIRINEANSVLRNPAKRQEYDAQLRAAKQKEQQAQQVNYNDLYENLRRDGARYEEAVRQREEAEERLRQQTEFTRRRRTSGGPSLDPSTLDEMYFKTLRNEAQECIQTLRKEHPEYESFAKTMKRFSAVFGLLAVLGTAGIKTLFALPAPLSHWTYVVFFVLSLLVLQGGAQLFGLKGNPFKLSFLSNAVFRVALANGLAIGFNVLMQSFGISNELVYLIPAGIAFTCSFSQLAELMKRFEFGQLVERDQNYTTIAKAVKGFRPSTSN